MAGTRAQLTGYQLWLLRELKPRPSRILWHTYTHPWHIKHNFPPDGRRGCARAAPSAAVYKEAVANQRKTFASRSPRPVGAIWTDGLEICGRARVSAAGPGAREAGSRPAFPHGRAGGVAAAPVWAEGVAPPRSLSRVPRAPDVHRPCRGNWTARRGGSSRRRLVYWNRSGRRRGAASNAWCAVASACYAVGTSLAAGNADCRSCGYCRRYCLGNSPAFGLPSHRTHGRIPVRCLVRLVLVLALRAMGLSTMLTP